MLGAVVLCSVSVSLVAALVSGCGSPGQARGAPDSVGLHGHVMNKAIAKPAVTLTDENGKPYDLRARTADRVTLLFFGYTHCPDVCPTVMADIAEALRQMVVIRSRVTVVFITSDPVRDTPAVLKAWLAHFDRQFVGLTGSQMQIRAAARAVGVPLAAPKRQKDGTYTVTHGSQVLAFGTDGEAHVVFTAQSTVDDYAHDLPLIVGGT